MAYLRPTSARISSTFLGHKRRNPPSQEPGTDYACAYGTSMVAPAAGRIVAIKNNTWGATGRYLTIDLDDGRRVRWLHLSKILVKNRSRVHAGQVIARSGASAWGRKWGVGAHVHVSLFPRHSYGGFGPNSTLDFEKYVGGSAAGGSITPIAPTIVQEDDMPIIIVQRKNSQLAKGQMTHNRRMREITRWENIAYRAAQDVAPEAVIYVTVTDAEYANLLAGKD